MCLSCNMTNELYLDNFCNSKITASLPLKKGRLFVTSFAPKILAKYPKIF